MSERGTPSGDEERGETGAGPERPIESSSQDYLGREGFVRRLVSALINAQENKSTGLVVGITGAWGSGKSSILNLVQERIGENFSNAVVVRFDPWLISGRNDLVSAFLGELLAAIKATPRAAALLKSAAGTMAQYGQHIAPAINLLKPGLGSVVVGLFGGLRTLFVPDKPLATLRNKLMQELGNAAVPIVVLVDEIDRIEDSEIRVLAQLIRAVADFPSISYLLAYDANRVAQALGSEGSPEQREERGHAYLEKIVQLQIPLPAIFDEELSDLIVADLEQLAEELRLPNDFESIERFRELLRVACGRAIKTPRDVTRLIGTYSPMRRMLLGEVDWVDLLAYSVLMTKAPATIGKIREMPGAFLGETLSYRDIEIQSDYRELSTREKLKRLVPEANDASGIRAMVEFVFPALAEHARYQSESTDPLSRRRPLLSTLRLGILPKAYPRRDIEEFTSDGSKEVRDRLAEVYSNGAIEGFISRLDELYANSRR